MLRCYIVKCLKFGVRMSGGEVVENVTNCLRELSVGVVCEGKVMAM